MSDSPVATAPRIDPTAPATGEERESEADGAV
ncbi:MAG: hypothetical protein QOC91_1134, partial [Solirubrobacteraceae bacterium]|nr:hypothetical protein [Solirubrobacteraceae bacterium]